MTRPRLGSLFSGYGGLDLAVEDVFGAETVFVSDIEGRDRKGAKVGDAPRILAHRFPGVPNLGDITTVDWATVPAVDIIAGGSPCQDISTAGRRAGMTEGTRSNLWVEMREAIAQLRPAFVVWENVYGALSSRAASAMESDPRLLGDDHRPGQPVLRALGRVLGDLAELGFDAEWHGLRAADVGACHGRARVFVLAAHPDRVGSIRPRLSRHRWAGPQNGHSEPLALLPTPTSRDHKGQNQRGDTTCLPGALALLPTPSASAPNDGEGAETWLARRERVKVTAQNGNGMGMPLSIAVQLLPTPRASDGANGGPNQRGSSGDLMLPSAVARERFGVYAPAISRQEQAFGRPAPEPTEPGSKGKPRLSAEFAAWMMGLPEGWVTDVPGMRRNWALHAIGNGVVPQQAAHALRLMLARSEWADFAA